MVANDVLNMTEVAQMLSKGYVTRDELAEIFNRPKKDISALISKGSLLVDKKNRDKIFLDNIKNAKYINNRIDRISKGNEYKVPFDNVNNPPAENRQDVKTKKVIPKTVVKVEKKVHERSRKPKDDDENTGIAAGLAFANAMDESKKRKLDLEVQIKELDFKTKTGELVYKSEIIPLITKFKTGYSQKLLVQTMTLIKELQVMYDQPTEMVGVFERDFIKLINSVSVDQVNELKNDIG